MGCCGGSSAVGADGPPEPRDFFYKRRHCTDLCCFIFFFAFWGGMGYITFLSITVGDPMSVFYGSDYLGNRCGVGSMSDKPKVYFPRIDEDVLAQSAIAATMPWKVSFYGLCMEDCPNVSSPTACFADPNACRVYDYGTAAQYTAAGGAASYIATMDSISLLNRCIPSDANTLTQDPDRCAFPQCDGGYYGPCDETYPTTWKMSFPKSLDCKVKFKVGKIEQLKTQAANVVTDRISGYAGGVQRFVDSVVASQAEVWIFGVAMPLVLGFVWLVLLRLFAKTMTYLMIVGVGVGLIALTLYLYLLAGAFAELLSLLAANSTVLAVTAANGTEDSSAWADNAHAQALGLVDSASTAVAQLAPSPLADAVNTSEAANPALWWILAVVMTILTLLYLVAMCSARRKIKVAVALVKSGTMVIKDRPATMLFPFGTLVAQLLLLLYAVLGVLFLFTAEIDASHFSGAVTVFVTASSTFAERIQWYNESIASGGAAGIASAEDSGWYIKAIIYLYFIFGFLWTLESINNIAWTAMSGSVAHWFFFRDDESMKTKIPLLRSLGRVFRYHLGSIFFGSFIIAFVQLLRLILLAVDRWTKKQQQSNLVVRLAVKCCMCCLYCLEKTLKFITDYSYIYVAMQGTGFCKSCFATFNLIMANLAQLSINTFVRTILSWIQLLALPVSCAFLTNIVCTMQNRAEVIYPTVVVALMAYVIARQFATVFSCVLNTLFVCCVRDKTEYKAQYMPSMLRSAFGFDKKSKKSKADDDDEAEANDELVAK